jgi:hypothetical protein
MQSKAAYSGDYRQAVAEGIADDDVKLLVAVADLLEFPDDLPFWPAISVATKTKTQLHDPASIAYTRAISIAAGRGALASSGKA